MSKNDFMDNVILDYLNHRYKYCTSKTIQDYKIIDNEKWVKLDNKTVQDKYPITAFQIRECLARLETKKLIITRYWHSKVRYFKLLIAPEDLKKKLIDKICCMSNENLLSINKFIERLK